MCLVNAFFKKRTQRDLWTESKHPLKHPSMVWKVSPNRLNFGVFSEEANVMACKILLHVESEMEKKESKFCEMEKGPDSTLVNTTIMSALPPCSRTLDPSHSRWP